MRSIELDRRHVAPPFCLFLSLLVLPLVSGCERFARGRGNPGATPIEVRSPVGGPTSPATVPDPCRGLPLPDDRHFVPDGMCARAVARKQGPLRQITFAPNGDLFGVTTTGIIRRYRDVDGDGVFAGDEVVDWASTGGDNGHNADFDVTGGYLYAGSTGGVRRWRWAPDLDHGGPGEDVVVGQPGGGNHPYHPLRVFDGVLYVDAGSLRNSMDPMPADYDTERSVIKRFPLRSFTPGRPFTWRDGEIFVRGARNVTGFARDAAGRMYGVVSGIDDLRYEGSDIHADNPGDSVVLLEKDAAFGFPYCFAAVRVMRGGRVVPPGTLLHADAASQNPLASVIHSTRDDAWCADHARAPLSVLQAHSSSLSIVFHDGPEGGLPARWRGGAFVALHGSWDRNPSTGYKIVWLPFDAEGRTPMATSSETATTFPYEVVFGGGRVGAPVDGAWGWRVGDEGEDVVRPVGVAVSPVDGALYVSSDNGHVALTKAGSQENGNLYRVGLARPASSR